MEYTVNRLAQMAGVSPRTLRWYDECGLLKPRRISSNGYRIYGQEETDRLQQILFYRELGVTLTEIGRILSKKDFDGLAALQGHHAALRAKRDQLNVLISNVEKSIQAMKGETIMQNDEKFEGFKQRLVDDNERQYGVEIREKFGNEAVDRSNAKMRKMTREQHAALEALSQELSDTLKAAFEKGDPAGELAQKTCALHKRWLCFFWDGYSREAHMGVAQTYVDDPRFAAYYDKIAPGCAVFLRDAVRIFCGK